MTKKQFDTIGECDKLGSMTPATPTTELESPLFVPIGSAVVAESCDTIAPERLEKARAAFELKTRGHTQEQIAESLDISRSTVVRLLNDYGAIYAQKLADSPRLHLLGSELSKLEEIETTARADAEKAKSARERQGYLKLSLQATRARQELLLNTGILPREPEKIVSLTHSLTGPPATKADSARTDDEVRASVMELLRYGRRM